MQNTRHRPEIDGLRALAVLPVILFHLDPQMLPNGFLGVDVFFVISGYLISGILLRSLYSGNFSLADFWARRVRRILPALVTILVVPLLAGWFVLFGPEWKSLAVQGLCTVTSTANFFYWRAAGDYWGQSAESMPLLHMWSLAVEEQFYLLYPPALWLISRRLPLRSLRWVLVFGAACSFVLMAIGVQNFRAAAFYLLPCRMWELLLGGWLATLDPAKPSRYASKLSGAGVLLLCFAYIVPGTGGELSPGACVLVTVATGLILRYGEVNSIVPRMLSVGPLLWIGKMSYSLYLWHWPVIVMAPLFLRVSIPGACCLILGLAWLSWLFIEQKTRYLPSRRFAMVVACQCVLLMVALCLPFSVPRATLRFDPPAYHAAANIQPPYTADVDGWTGTWQTGLTLGRTASSGQGAMVLLGDSHGVMYFLPVKQAAEAFGMTLTSFAADGGTSPFLVPDGDETTDYGPGWDRNDRLRFDAVRRGFIEKNRPRIAVLTGRWAHYLTLHGAEGLEKHFRDLLDVFPKETSFVVIGQPPELPFGSGGFADGELSIPPFRAFFEDDQLRSRRMTAHQVIRGLSAKDGRILFVDVQPIFDSSVGIRFLEGQVIYYRDDDHLSMAGAALCADVIRNAVGTVFSRDGSIFESADE